MEWKEVFKPDWKKIGLFVVIFAILGFIPLFPTYTEVNVCPDVVGASGCQTPEMGYFKISLFDIIPPLMLDFYGFLFPATYLVVSYLLSCLIIFIYNKLKLKK